MIIGVLLGLSISVFLFSILILIIGNASPVTAAIIGNSSQIFYPLLALTISFIMILLIVLTIIKKHSDN